MKKILFFVACGILIFQSCKKYEDGPVFSLRSKTARVEGTWGLDKLIVNAQPEVLTPDDLDDRWEFASGKKLTLTDPGNSTFVLQWEFSSDKKSILISDPTSTDAVKLIILRLTNTEFWYYIIDGTDKEEYHMKAK